MKHKKPTNTLSTLLLSLMIVLQGFPSSAHAFSPSTGFLPGFTYNKPLSTSTHGIWERVRKRFKLPVSKNHPTFKHQLKRISKSQDYVNELANNASPYLYYILEEVEKRNMPSEIALLPMIESTYNPHARSNKGAAGLWQLMPGTGKIYGLKQTRWYDGRKDIYESTNAALDYLQYLHKRFDGNWSLALAAYNSGENKVLRAMKHNRARKKPTDYWSLNLPKQTTNFVPKLLAIAAIIKAPDKYGVDLPVIPNKPVFTRIDTGKAIDIAHAAKLADVPVKQIQKLNPGLHNKSMSPSGPYKLVVPVKSAATIKNKVKAVVPSKGVSPIKAVAPVTREEKDVVVKAKVEPKAKLKPKTKAKVKASTLSKKAKSKGLYTVRKGDNVEKIALRHKTTRAALMRANGLSNDVIVVGRKLKIPS